MTASIEQKREQARIASQKWRLAHPEKARALSKRRWAEKREQVQASNKKWYEANKARVLAAHRLRRYGLSQEEYDAMCEAQEHRCAICKQQEELVVDHCHKTGEIRGLPCDSCNKGLGFFRDNPELLAAAIEYLRGEKNSCQH